MYDSASGLHVYLQPHGTDLQYTEHEAPRGSPIYTGNARERCIEAITGQRFVMVVELPPEFSFKGSSHIQMTYDVGDGKHGFKRCCASEEIILGKSFKDIASTCRVLSNGTWQDAGVWQEIGFVFGELTPNNIIDLSEDQQAVGTFERERVRITVQRGTAQERSVSAGELDLSETWANLDLETTRSAAIERGKRHSTRSVISQTIEPPKGIFNFIPAENEEGEEVTFTFFCATRELLEANEILPKTSTSQTPNKSRRARKIVTPRVQPPRLRKKPTRFGDIPCSTPAAATRNQLPRTAPKNTRTPANAQVTQRARATGKKPPPTPTSKRPVASNRKRAAEASPPRKRQPPSALKGPRPTPILKNSKETSVSIDESDAYTPLPTKKVSWPPAKGIAFKTPKPRARPKKTKTGPDETPAPTRSGRLRATPANIKTTAKKQTAKEREKEMLKEELREIQIKKRLRELDAEDDG